jgi:drug/metabolite transporter (DMT)-like permease
LLTLKPRDLAAYITLALVWGLSFMIVVKVVAAFGWAGAVSSRSIAAAGALYAIARAMGRRLDFSGTAGKLAIIGFLNVTCQLAGIAFAAPIIGTAMTAILVSAIPLFSMLIGRVMGIERIGAAGAAGIAMGMAGIAMLVGFPAVPVTTSFLLACGLSIGGSFAAALGSIYASEKLKDIGTWEVTIGSFLAGGLLLLPLLLVVPVPIVPQPMDYVWLLVMGLVTSGLMYVLYFDLVSRIGATRAISVEFAVTVVAVAAGTMILGETLTPMQIAGAAVIVTGCALVLGIVPGLGRTGQQA